MEQKLSDKFIYTEEDAKGCTFVRHDYSQCIECILNDENNPEHCVAFHPYKPAQIVVKKEPCKYRRIITDETEEERKARYAKLNAYFKKYGFDEIQP